MARTRMTSTTTSTRRARAGRSRRRRPVWVTDRWWGRRRRGVGTDDLRGLRRGHAHGGGGSRRRHAGGRRS
eukprot:5737589-Prymnesium_polylepis.1